MSEPEAAFADTNLFIRYLEQDHPEHSPAARRVLERVRAGTLKLVTTPMVVAELVWTLKSFYKRDNAQIVQWLLALANTPGIELRERDRVIQALVWFEEKNVDFIDAYHAAWLVEQAFDTVIGFDKKHFRRFEHVTLDVPT